MAEFALSWMTVTLTGEAGLSRERESKGVRLELEESQALRPLALEEEEGRGRVRVTTHFELGMAEASLPGKKGALQSSLIPAYLHLPNICLAGETYWPFAYVNSFKGMHICSGCLPASSKPGACEPTRKGGIK